MMNTDRGKHQISLILMIPLSVFTTDLCLSSFKDLESHFEASPFELQLSLCIYFIGMAFFTLSSALFVQRFGNKKILISGIFIYLIGTLLSLFAPHIHFFIIGRFLQSFGGSSTSVITRSMASKNPSTLTYMFVSMSLALIISPLLGNCFHSFFGWQANFVFMAILGFCYLIMALILSDEKKEQKPFQWIIVLNEIKSLISLRQYYVNTLFVILAWGGFLSFVLGAPFFMLYHFKQPPKTFAILYSLIMIGFISGNLLSRKLKSVLPLGMASILSGSGILLTFLISPKEALFITASFVYLFGTGLVLPCVQIKAINAPQQSHYAFGLMYFAMMIFGSICGLAINSYSHITGMVAIVMALLGLILAFFFLLLRSQAIDSITTKKHD